MLADDLGAKSASRRQRQKSFPTGELHLIFCKQCQQDLAAAGNKKEL